MAQPGGSSRETYEDALRTVAQLEAPQLVDLADAIAARLQQLEDSKSLSDYAKGEIDFARKELAEGQHITLDEFLRKHA